MAGEGIKRDFIIADNENVKATQKFLDEGGEVHIEKRARSALWRREAMFKELLLIYHAKVCGEHEIGLRGPQLSLKTMNLFLKVSDT